MKTKILSIIAACTLMTGCATIFTGTKDTLTFTSKPSGAKVYIDGLEVCTTPCTKEVKRSLGDKTVELKLDGYQTRVITLDKKFNLVSIINLGSIIGWVVDAATGSLMQYDRKGYDVELEKKNGLSFNDSQKIEIDSKNKTVDFYIVQK